MASAISIASRLPKSLGMIRLLSRILAVSQRRDALQLLACLQLRLWLLEHW